MKKMSKLEWLKWMAASFASSVVLPSFLSSCGKGSEQTLEPESGEEQNGDEPTDPASQVWMTTDLSAAGLLAVYRAVGRQATGRVAVKISTGKPGGHHFLQPSLIADLVHEVNGNIVECNTAYGGQRANTAMHYQVAEDHGFTGIADFVVLDKDPMTAEPNDIRNIQEVKSKVYSNRMECHFQ